MCATGPTTPRLASSLFLLRPLEVGTITREMLQHPLSRCAPPATSSSTGEIAKQMVTAEPRMTTATFLVCTMLATENHPSSALLGYREDTDAHAVHAGPIAKVPWQ
jgi:hypothetical protein